MTIESALATGAGLRSGRDALIDEHIAAECDHDVPRALRTFATPHYHVFPLVIDAPGVNEVAGLLHTVFAAFPDFAFVAERRYHADSAVIVEGRIVGTQRGSWLGHEPSEQAVDVPTCCLFHFDEDRLVSETVYLDHATMLQQIGAA